MKNEPEIRDLEKKKLVYSVISKCPGIEFRELQARTKLNMGELRSELNYLAEQGLVIQKEDESYYRFFSKDGLSEQEKRVMLFLRQYQIREIIIYLLQNPGSKLGEVAKKIHISNSTMIWHLKKLSDAGLLIVTHSGWPASARIKVAHPEMILKLLVAYKESFLDKMVDKFIDSWAGN